jgi:MFS transporter, PAT family, beta-lactamase induction signal transducer AmpG
MEKKQSPLRLALFGLIYFVQGAMLTYFLSFNVIYLRSYDVDFSVIGIVNGITLIPFVLKIFIGLLSDRINFFGLGHRKPYIIIGLVLQIIAFLLMPGIHPVAQSGLYITVLLLAALGMSTYDTCTDGLSIDTTPKDQRGLVQGLMVGGRALSSIISAYIFGLLANAGQWQNLFFLVSATTFLALILVLWVKEPAKRIQEPHQPTKSPYKALGDGAFLIFLLIGLIYPLALYSTNSMISPFLNESLGLGMNVVGTMLALFGVGTILGAIVGGPLMKWLGRRTSLYAALAITVIATLGLALAPQGIFTWSIVFLFGVAFGYYETVFFALAMDFCHPAIAAFMFSIAMAVGNLGIGAGQPLAGLLVDRLGFQFLFLISAGIHVLVVPLSFILFKKRKDLVQENLA